VVTTPVEWYHVSIPACCSLRPARGWVILGALLLLNLAACATSINGARHHPRHRREILRRQMTVVSAAFAGCVLAAFAESVAGAAAPPAGFSLHSPAVSQLLMFLVLLLLKFLPILVLLRD